MVSKSAESLDRMEAMDQAYAEQMVGLEQQLESLSKVLLVKTTQLEDLEAKHAAVATKTQLLQDQLLASQANERQLHEVRPTTGRAAAAPFQSHSLRRRHTMVHECACTAYNMWSRSSLVGLGGTDLTTVNGHCM